MQNDLIVLSLDGPLILKALPEEYHTCCTFVPVTKYTTVSDARYGMDSAILPTDLVDLSATEGDLALRFPHPFRLNSCVVRLCIFNKIFRPWRMFKITCQIYYHRPNFDVCCWCSPSISNLSSKFPFAIFKLGERKFLYGDVSSKLVFSDRPSVLKHPVRLLESGIIHNQSGHKPCNGQSTQSNLPAGKAHHCFIGRLDAPLSSKVLLFTCELALVKVDACVERVDGACGKQAAEDRYGEQHRYVPLREHGFPRLVGRLTSRRAKCQ